MASTIITKNSSTASAVPVVGDLTKGELAVNVTDKKIYTKDNSAAVVKLVGSLGNQEANAVAITGGSIAGITDLAVADGGTGSSTAAGARSNLSAAASGANSDITSLSGLTTALSVAQGGTGVTSSTGSGSVVLSNSPTLVTPALGTPSAAVLTNATGLPLSTGISGLGTGVATFLGTPSSANLLAAVTDETGTGALVFANSPTLVTPALGTPSSATLTNATGLPISTGVSGLGTGVATFLATPSSANLRSALTDETGTGSAVFATSPALVTPDLGTPSAATLTNATGLPISTGVSGLGTGVATALAVNVGSAGAPVVNGGALGTPSSGTVTNLTGTASININGTVGATTPTTGAFTTLSASSTVTLSGGTANGVTYLNGSKVLTSGSALTFDGTNFASTGIITSTNANGLRAQYPSSASYYAQLDSRDGNTYLSAVGSTAAIVFRATDGPGTTAEGMRLTSTGLGIGTSSPSTKLHLTVSAASTACAAFFNTDTANGNGVFIRAGGVNSGKYALAIESAASSSIMYLESTGNLGIGTSSPATKLTVYDATTPQVTFNNGTSTFIVGNNSGGNNKILYGTGAYPMIFYTNATEAMRIDASGNLLVGGTSVYGATITSYASSTRSGGLGIRNSAGTVAGGIYTGASGSGGGSTDVYVEGAGILGFITNSTERARITSGGSLLVGQTTGDQSVQGIILDPYGTGRFVTNNGGDNVCLYLNRIASDGAIQKFLRTNTEVGSVSVTTTATTYNTSSDYRLKNITGPITTSGAYIDSLNPVEGTWKADGSTFVGLIAHEIQEASRTTVATGVKDGEEMQGMDYSNAELIANLIAEVKSLRARVAQLESN